MKSTKEIVNINKWNKTITIVSNLQKSPQKVLHELFVDCGEFFSDWLENIIGEIQFLVKFYPKFCTIFKSEKTNDKVMLFVFFFHENVSFAYHSPFMRYLLIIQNLFVIC